MKIIENQKFGYKEILIGEIIENTLFKSCILDNCMLSYVQTNAPSEASILRNCQFLNCTVTDASSHTDGIIENVTFENLKVDGTLFLTNVLFSNVTFKEKIGKLSLSNKMEFFAQIFDAENNTH